MQRRLITLMVVVLVGAGSATAAAATAPRNTVRPTISGTARQGEILTANPGTWSGTQPITFTYQWRRCDANGANCSNIIGATSKTYTLTSADVSNAVRVLVRASNSSGSAQAVSPPRAVLATPPPTSVSLHVGRSTVTYGGAVSLSGSVANGQAGETVTITEHQLPSLGDASVRTVATVQTATDGSFNAVVRPVVRSLYRANGGQAASNTVSVNVRPRLSLTRLRSHRFVLRATAARSLVGSYSVLQRLSLSRHRWITARRVFFTRAFQASSPTIMSRAVFRARLGRARIRVLIPNSQLPQGYVSGVSNVLSA